MSSSGIEETPAEPAPESAWRADERRLAAELEVVCRIGQIAVSGRDLTTMLPAIARATLGVVGAESCCIELWNPESDDTELAADESVPDWPGAAAPGTRYRLDDYPSTRRALAEGAPILLDPTDPRLSPVERAEFESDGIRSVLLLPLVIANTALGVCFFYSRRRQAFDDHAIWLGREIAAQTALAIQNARFLGQIRQAAARQAALLQVSQEAEARLRRSEAEFRVLFARNPLPTWVYDQTTLTYLAVNDVAVTHYGFSRDEFLAMRVTDVQYRGEGRTQPLQPFPNDLTHHWARQTRHRTNDGRIIAVELTSHPLIFQSRPAVLVIAQDVTARLALEAQLAHQAFHDALTGLPNRALFLDRLARALDRSSPVAVLFVDLDNFKVVNDSLGHRGGDAVLLTVGQRLTAEAGPHDTIARLGGDEFTVLLEGVGEPEAVAVAERLVSRLREPMAIDGQEVRATPSIGIALGVPGRHRPDDVLRQADLAMYDAKHGRGPFAVYNAAMDRRGRRRLQTEAELRRAIAADQLRLEYQPVVDLRSGRISQVEALVRWQHPRRGLLPPSDFIPLAEESGLILDLERWVLTKACRQGWAWQTDLVAPAAFVVGVNLSARQFRNTSLVAEIAGILTATGLDPSCLELEITETVAIHDLAATAATLRVLKALGVRLAIDDFGSGYSGFSYLQHFPIDMLKIDRSAIAGLGRDISCTAIVRAVMAFADTLGLAVTAEGIETAEQRQALLEVGCHLGQGYFFTPPRPATQVGEWLVTTPPWVCEVVAGEAEEGGGSRL